LISSIAAPAFLWWRGDIALAVLFAGLSLLLWLMHSGNIARLTQGRESKIGAGSTAANNP
jgi:glycerol-3-phosphate acyltransferase PlsY